MPLNLGRYARRSTAIERIDAHDASDEDLSRVFDFQDAVARWTGGRNIVHAFLRRASRLWNGPLTVLHLGCGRGDLARSIVAWGRRNGVDIRVHGVDRYGRAIHLARERHQGLSELTFEVRDLNDPFFLQARQFDYTVSEMALHRENDARAELFLKTANRVARRGLIAVDWIRDPRPVFVLGALARWSACEAVRHDARVAVQRGFRLREADDLRAAAGLDFAQVRAHFGYRFSVEGERGLVRQPAFAPITGLAT